jgi:hypothetical protein
MNQSTLHTEIINHRDAGDLLVDILEAQIEFGDDKHAFGVRVANLLNDFADKVTEEFEQRTDVLASALMKQNIDQLNASGDFMLKDRKEAA